MRHADLLKALFESHLRGEDAAFRQAAAGIIQDERKNRRLASAKKLEQILLAAPDASVSASASATQAEHALFDEQQPAGRLEDLVLSPVTSGLVERVMRDFRESKKLQAHGVRLRHRVLFCGPPGCGKTATAAAIAVELGLPLLNVHLDAVVSSHLGETAKNLERVFAHAGTKSFVILLDDFDFVGRSRDDATERGELKRILNGFLQVLDRFTGRSLIIGTTSFEQSLDRAVWRRFADVIRFERPREAQVEELIRKKLAPLQVQNQQVNDLLRNLSGSTLEEVEGVCLDVRKSCILRDQNLIDGQDLREAIARHVYRQSILQKIARAASATVDFD
jgi:SpoVK/Ycf46/Vps4 family AAA+-type ATPase